MSRRSRAQKTLANPDPIYNSRLVTLLISRVLQAGKKITCSENCIRCFRNNFH